MIPNKGLYLDCNPIDQPPGTWRNAKNILVSKIKNAFTNEDGTSILDIPVDVYNTQPIGGRAFPDESQIIFSAGETSRIGIVDRNGIYTDLIIDSAFGFDANFPIRSIEVDFNFLGERIVAWTDKNVTPKILNIDNLPFALNPDKSLVDPTEIINGELFPTFNTPGFNFTIGQSGGAVRSGNYSACIAYENNDGTRTTNTIPIKNINIVDDPTSVGFDKFDGIAPDTLTGKIINFNLTNVDTHYDKLVLIIVARRNNIVTAFEVKKVNITSNIVNVTYIGNEVVIPLDLTQVLASRPIYTKIGTLTQLQSKLYAADLETDTDIEFQSYANNIRLFYNTKLVALTDLTASQKNEFPGGFPHGGVCAFYITLLLNNGSKSRAFHIPGLELSSGVLDTVSAPSTIGNSQGITGKKFQIEDTTNNGGFSYTIDPITGINSVSDKSSGSNMGYWENENEVYPIGFPDNTGLPVRHHVFPTIRKCKNLHYSGHPEYGITHFDILGIDVVNVIIPDNLKPLIKGWYISYAKRDYTNSNTFGTDIFITGHLSSGNPNHYSSAGGNWNARAIRDNGSNWNDGFIPDPIRMRGHNFDLLYDKPNLGASLFIDFELFYIKNNLTALYKDVGKQGGNLVNSGQGSGQNAGALIDLTDPINTSVFAAGASILRKVVDYKYLPTGIIDGNYHTIKNEEAIHITVSNALTTLFNPGLVHLNKEDRTSNVYVQPVAPFTNGGENTYLISYKVVRTDLYNDFDKQLLITTNEIVPGFPTEKLGIYGGDHFISVRSFICTSQRYVNDPSPTEGTTVIRAHISENRHNIGLRYEIPGDVTTKYYPKTPPFDFWSNPSNPNQDGVTMIFDRTQNPNGTKGYSEDYNAVNDLNQTIIFNVGQITTNKFPYRVIRSGFAGATSTSLNSWKTFLSADYYDSNRNRGRIENIATLNDTLLIHHLYGLFYTLGSQKLALGATEVFLGTSDIFTQVPKEPMSTKLGYLGCQNIFSTLSFKGFYGWWDQSQGRAFTISEQGTVEISNAGVYNFFRDNSKINIDLPNSPVVGEGLITGFDPKYNRILFTKKSDTNSFTLSYSLDNNFWVAFHDYVPSLYYNTVNQLYAIAEQKVHKMNVASSKGKFFNEDIKSSYVNIIFNQFPSDIKVFYNINWISELYDSLGVLLRNETISHITINNNFQTTGKITLTPHQDFNNKGNIRKLRSKWNFNKIKDITNGVTNKKPITSEYIDVRFEYGNSANLDSTQNSLYLYLLSCNFRGN